MSTSKVDNSRRRLLATMIVRDEAAVLAQTIQSAQVVADEVWVLDTGSTDGTAELAERLGARVSRTLWEADFAQARNHLLEEVDADWVLWLDAGEQVVPETALELRQFVDQQADPRKVYLIMVELPPAQAGACPEQAAQVRLMPLRPELRFVGRVRETLLPAADRAGLELDLAPGRILRHARHHCPEVKARKAQRDLNLVAKESEELGQAPPRLLLAAGEAYSNLKDYERARTALAQALRIAPRGSTEMLEAYYGLLAVLEAEGAAPQAKLPICLEALEIYPLDAQLLCAMGSYLQAANHLELAARSYQMAVQYGQVNLQTWHLKDLAEMAAACLGLVRQVQGQHEEALRVYQDAIHRYPESARLRRRLLEVCIKLGRLEQALSAASGLKLDPAQREAMEQAIRGACKATDGHWVAALGHLQSAYLLGCRDPICLKWLAVTLLSHGQWQAASPIVQQWLHQEPQNAEAQAYQSAIERQAWAGEAEQETPASGEVPSAVRYIRIDPATTVLDCLAPQWPAAQSDASVNPAPEAGGM